MKVLGLDLGVASIGWALIELDDNLRPVEICGLGSRIVNLAVNEDSDFIKGKGESVNSQRTLIMQDQLIKSGDSLSIEGWGFVIIEEI